MKPLNRYSFVLALALGLCAAGKSNAQPDALKRELDGVPGFKVNTPSSDECIVFMEGPELSVTRVKKIATFRGITHVFLTGKNVNDDILSEAAKIKGLKGISVLNGDISDLGVKHLSNCVTLESVALPKALITDSGVITLAKLPRLTRIDFVNAKQVTDLSIKELTAKCAFLKDLNLIRTGITDQALKDMEKLQNLREVMIYDTNTTKEQVAALKKAKPSASILGP